MLNTALVVISILVLVPASFLVIAGGRVEGILIAFLLCALVGLIFTRFFAGPRGVQWVVSISLGVLAVSFLYAPRIPNFGLPIGYYGKFNRVLSHIEQCPNLVLAEVSGIHRDITLEDFWLKVTSQKHGVHEIEFRNANIRSVSDMTADLKDLGC